MTYEIPQIRSILVLGGGTAGFLSALAIKKRVPGCKVSVLQSSKLGIIGVGEGSLRQLPGFLHRYLDIDPRRFFDDVGPTWKLGIRFLWGERGDFNYTFSPQLDVLHPHPDLSRPIGFYCYENMEKHCVASVLMRNDSVFIKDRNGNLDIRDDYGYHLDNHRFAAFLEQYAIEQGVPLIDDLVTEVITGERGVESLQLESGDIVSADLFVDCSGFTSLLLGKTMNEPFESYRSSLFCDRAIIGGWDRSNEPIHPYTTSESMDAGWAWQIEHEERINRGYVYASGFVSDDEANAEFKRKNPHVEDTSTVRFRSGRYRNAWVDNVVAVGNSAGFVEPLEATAIAAICTSARALAETLAEGGGHVSPTARKAFNKHNARSWDSIADFLAVHYRFNNLLNTPFWEACRADVDLRGAAPIVEFYQENGPSQLWRIVLEDPLCRFRLDGYYTLLVGQKVPHAKLDIVSERERSSWKKLQDSIVRYASAGESVPAALKRVKAPEWQWHDKHFSGS